MAVRTIESVHVADGITYIEAAGLSTDAKPTTGVATGSVFIEVDTGKAFFFNEDAGTWTEVGA